MLFTTVIYFLFLACSVPVYYLLPAKYRMYFLIALSAFFYMYVKTSYIFLILFVILSNYWFGLMIARAETKKKRKMLAMLILVINLGILVFFKYWNFLLTGLFGLLQIPYNDNSSFFLDIALPLGLSYYIFQTIGYIADISRGSAPPEKNIFRFSMFMLFFPKLLVGPIERANHFLPQLYKRIYFDKENIIEGGRRIAWGLFKKLVVADRILLYQNVVFAHAEEQSGLTLLFASILYTFQVYADFSGYTDIAVGTARLFGYDLMENFRQPLLAKNVSDFWRRWHISLSSWVNDYIFNPLALNNRHWGQWAVFYALLVSFTVIGIWHGASWNYVIFGVLQAFALIYETITKKQRKKLSKKLPSFFYNNLSILLTFLFVCFSLIIFRSATYQEAVAVIEGIFTNKGSFFIDTPSTLLFMLMGCGVMMLYEIDKEFKIFRISLFSNKNWAIQQLSYACLIIYILLAGVFDGGQFIYFAF